MPFIYFVGPYKPVMCGIADYTSFLTRCSPAGQWAVISFDLDKYGVPLTAYHGAEVIGHVWYGMPGRNNYNSAAVRQGLSELGAKIEGSFLWFQHEFGIWPGKFRFIAMLKNLPVPKVVSFHTIHFQSGETPTGLCKEQYDLLRLSLPYVDAITVFSNGAFHAVTSAFPEYSQKVHIIKHGIHSYPEISRLSRRDAKEKLNDFLLYESDLDQETKEVLHRQRVFIDPKTFVLGQAGFLAPAKGSELLYAVRGRLEKVIPHRKLMAVRIGSPREEVQIIYAKRLRRLQNDRSNLFLETWLPPSVFALALRAFDINFNWPSECTQSGVLAHALGTGAVVAGRGLEGVGETLKEAGELVDTDLRHLIVKIQEIILNPELTARIEERALSYADELSWGNQARKHYKLADHILSSMRVRSL